MFSIVYFHQVVVNWDCLGLYGKQLKLQIKASVLQRAKLVIIHKQNKVRFLLGPFRRGNGGGSWDRERDRDTQRERERERERESLLSGKIHVCQTLDSPSPAFEPISTELAGQPSFSCVLTPFYIIISKPESNGRRNFTNKGQLRKTLILFLVFLIWLATRQKGH